MRIRSALPHDAAAIKTLAARLQDQPLPEWRDAAPLSEKLENAVEAYDGAMPEDHTVLVCEGDGGELLGYAHAGMDADFFSGEPQGHLYYLATDPAFEGRGAGRKLLEAIETWAQKNGATGIMLYVFATNDRARKVYQKYGFQDDMLKLVKPI